jgi:hypothetical protein
MASKFCKNYCDGICKDVYNCSNGLHKQCPVGMTCLNSACILGHTCNMGIRTMIHDIVSSNEHNDVSFSERCRFNLVCNNSKCNLRHDVDITKRYLINKIILEFYKKNTNYKDNNTSYTCRYHQTCNNPDCTFSHKINYITREKIIKIVKDFKDSGANKCKNNLICNNKYCNYTHDVDMEWREIIIHIVNEYKTKNGMIHIKNMNEPALEDGFVYYAKNTKKIINKIEVFEVKEDTEEIQKIKVIDYIKPCDQKKLIAKDVAKDDEIESTPLQVVSYKDIVRCSYNEYLEEDVQNEIVAGTDWNDFM